MDGATEDFAAMMAEIGAKARAAAAELAFAGSERKSAALISAAHAVWERRQEILDGNYIDLDYGRAKGLSPARVLAVHALRNALIPVLTVVGLQTGSLLAGAVLTETIFSWPGIGKWLIDAIARRDYPVVQAGILVTALTFIAVNLLVDLLNSWANPRLRGAA